MPVEWAIFGAIVVVGLLIFDRLRVVIEHLGHIQVGINALRAAADEDHGRGSHDRH